MKKCTGCFRVAVLTISFFQVASNCKEEFEDYEFVSYAEEEMLKINQDLGEL